MMIIVIRIVRGKHESNNMLKCTRNKNIYIYIYLRKDFHRKTFFFFVLLSFPPSGIYNNIFHPETRLVFDPGNNYAILDYRDGERNFCFFFLFLLLIFTRCRISRSTPNVPKSRIPFFINV